MKKIYYKIKLLLILNSEKEVFENKTFSIVTFVGVITCSLFFITNIYTNSYFLTNLIVGLSGVTFSVFFYLSTFRGITKPLILPFQILVALVLTINWFYFQGIEGSAPLFFFPAMFLLIYSDSKNKYWSILISYVFLAILLIGIQYLYPEWTIPYPDKNSRIIDLSLGFIISLFVLGYATIVLKKNFGHERSKTEQKNKELKISEARFRDIAMSSGDWIWEVDQNNRYTYCSEKVTEILGYTPSEMIAKTILDFMPEDEVEKVREEFQQIMHERKAFKDLEIRNLTKAGKRICVLTSGVPVIDDQGSLIGYRGTDTNITERKRTEEALYESEERYRNIFNNSIEGIFQTTLDGQLQIINPAFARMFGYESPGEMIANVNNIGEQLYVNREDRKRFIKLHRTSKGLLADFEVQFKHRDGSRFWVMINSRIIQDHEGVSPYLEGTMIDITKRKQAEKVIRVSEARLRRAEIASRSGNWELYLDSQIMIASEGAIKLYGLDKTQNDYDSIKEIPLPEYRPLLDEALKKLIEDNQPYDIEFKIKTADTGEIKDIHSVAIYNKEKRILFGIIQDITERKQAEDNLVNLNLQLNELNATKDKFFSIIAHDLRSPFNAILGFSNLLVEQMKAREYEGVEEYAGVIQNSSYRAMDLLINLLEWSRSQTGRIEFNPEYVEMVSLINEVTALLNDTAQQKSITISRKNPDSLSVFADKAMISTVLRNLISNAIKFTNPGGTIVISAEQNSDRLLVTVCDNGVGIRKEAIDKLFRIEENSSTIGTQNEKGSGLGLLLCKEFILKHGGEIWVESELGKGSEFHFTLPKFRE